MKKKILKCFQFKEGKVSYKIHNDPELHAEIKSQGQINRQTMNFHLCKKQFVTIQFYLAMVKK